VPSSVPLPTISNWTQNPSVGTWFGLKKDRTQQIQASTCVTVEHASERRGSWNQVPSVGTWLSQKSVGLPENDLEEQPLVERTTSGLLRMPKEALVDGFKKSLKQKDEEISELKRMLAMRS